jgi:hypothetical protein
MTALANARSVNQAAVCQWTDQRTRVRACSTTSMISPPDTSDPHPRCREASMVTLVTGQQVT